MRTVHVVSWVLAGGLCALLLWMNVRGAERSVEPGAGDTSSSYHRDGRPRVPVPARGERPNIIVVLIDTLRADAIEPRAGAGPDMPFLARMAAEHVSFTQASSPSPWTMPALCALLTSLRPSRQRATGVGEREPILADVPTFAAILTRALGYQAFAHFGPFTKATVETFGRGFDDYGGEFDLQGAATRLAHIARTSEAGRPFHLLLHTYEAHDPYGQANHPPIATSGPDGVGKVRPEALAALEALGPDASAAELTRRSLLDEGQRAVLQIHPRFRARKAEMIRYMWDGLARDPQPELAQELEAAYRRGLTWVDGLLERLVEDLRRLGLLENTLLIVTSDHGEAFGEHGMLAHGRQLYDELLRVPLVMWGPAPFDAPRTIPHSVGLIDLFPTLLDWLGAPPLTDADGVSFLPLLRGEGGGHPVLAEEVRPAGMTAGASAAVLASARNERWKYIVTLDNVTAEVREEAYDLRVDPGEQNDLALPEGTLPPEHAPGTDGSAVGLAWDAAFCRAVERARDRVWAAAPARGEMGGRRSLPPRPAPRRPTSP